MVANSLYPAFIQVQYESAYGPHRMTLPTAAWSAAMGSAGYGGYLNWLEAEVDAKMMIDDFFTVFKVALAVTTHITQAIIYTMSSPTAEPQPQRSYPVSIVGTSAISGWDRGTQRTYSCRTEEFGRFKLTILDAPVDNDFAKVYTLLSWEQDIIDVLLSSDYAWSGRDGAKPTTFISEAVCLNKRLRRAYRIL